MKDCTRLSYWLSIVLLFTQKVIRTGRGGWEGEWRKWRGLRELAGLRRFGEAVEMCGKVKTYNLDLQKRGTPPDQKYAPWLATLPQVNSAQLASC